MAKFEVHAPNKAATVLVFIVFTFTSINWLTSSPIVYTWLGAVVAVVCLCLYAKFLLTAIVPAKQLGSIDRACVPGCTSDASLDCCDSNFPISSPDVQALSVPNDRLVKFASEVAQIYAVADDGMAPAARCSEVLGNQQQPTAQQLKAALEQLYQIVESSGPEHWRFHEPLDDVYLSRVLVAKDFEAKKAANVAEAYIKWRQTVGGGVAPTASWVESGLVLVPFEDRRGRPVVLIRAKYHQPSIHTPKFIEAGVRATLDAVVAHFLHKRSGQVAQNNPLEQYVLVIDARGAGMSNFSKANLAIMLRESNDNYTERLGKVVILGCNSTIEFIWSKLVCHMLHPRTRRKVFLERQGAVTPFLAGFVDLEDLPREYGGRAADIPEPGQAGNLSGSVGAITAAVWERLGIDPLGAEFSI